MTERFNVVFAGEIAGRADPAVVRANVGRLFNASEAVLDKLFSGQPVVIKKMVDRETAMMLRARMKQAGANASMVPVDDEGRPLQAVTAPASAPAAPAPAPAPTAAPASPPPESLAARMQRQAEQEAAAQPARPVAPSAAAPAAPGSLTVAPTGTDLLSAAERQVPPPVQVDLSGISMAPAGSEVLREGERRQVEAVRVDISGLSMAEAGAPLEELQEAKVLLNPDISHLSLAPNK